MPVSFGIGTLASSSLYFFKGSRQDGISLRLLGSTSCLRSDRRMSDCSFVILFDAQASTVCLITSEYLLARFDRLNCRIGFGYGRKYLCNFILWIRLAGLDCKASVIPNHDRLVFSFYRVITVSGNFDVTSFTCPIIILSDTISKKMVLERI